jgi:hypothetical protein
MAMASAEKHGCNPLRPRNISVPSYRPMQSSGSTPCVGQFGPGSGEGQHTCTGSDARRMCRAGADVQSKAKGSGQQCLCALLRSLTQRDKESTTCQATPVMVQFGVRLTRSAPYPLKNFCISNAVSRFSM